MCACAPVLPETEGPGPAQTTPMTHVSANMAHRQAYGTRASRLTESDPPTNRLLGLIPTGRSLKVDPE